MSYKLTADMISELESIKHPDGSIVPEEVVELAQDASTALHHHSAFEWDVEKAAYSSWVEAARGIIQVWTKVVDDRGDGEKRVMRATVSIVDDTGHRSYQPTDKALKQNRLNVINLVLDHILSHIHSYPLPEFDPIVRLVGKIRQEAVAAAAKRKAKEREKRRRSGRGRGGEARV